jgi:hypothetical protein
MTTTSKLRVAISDSSAALEIVKIEVEGATGCTARPEFQESELDALVVEMRLVDSDPANLGLVARAIECTSPSLDVLGVWSESSPDRMPSAVPARMVYSGTDDSMPNVAKRAVRDELPSAQWHPCPGGEPGDDRPHWQLAVPVVLADGEKVVAVRRRNGYSHRFTTDDAVSTWLGLAV